MRLVFLRRVMRGERPAQAVLLTVATQGVVIVLNVVTGVITARLLGPTGRGIFAAATLWPQFLSGLAVLGLPSALVFYLRRDEARRDTIVTVGILLALAAALLATLAGVVLVSVTMRHYGGPEVLLAWFCVAWTGPYLLTVVLRQVMAAYGRFRSFNISSYLPPLLYALLLIPAGMSMQMTAGIASFCLMVPSGAVLAWMVFDLCRVWRPSTQGLGEALRLIARYAARAAPGDVVTGILSCLDRLVLVALLAPEVLGLYAVAYSLSRLLLVLQTVCSAVLFPQMAGVDAERAKQLHDLAFRLVVYVSVAAVLVAVAFGRPALSLVYGGEFGQAAPVLIVLVAEAGLACAGQVTGQLFLALHRPGWVSIAQGVSLLVAAVGLAVLVPNSAAIGGALGAALALFTASLARLLVLLPGIRWRLRLTLPRMHPTRGDVRFLRGTILSS